MDRVLQNIVRNHRDKTLGAFGEEHREDLVDVLLRLQKNGDLEHPLSDTVVKATLLRTNARPPENERSSTRERTLVDLLLLDDRSFHTGRLFVRWSTSVRSLMDEHSFADGRAFVRWWTSVQPIPASSKWAFYSSLPPAIGPLSDHLISTITHEMSIPRREGGVLEVPHLFHFIFFHTFPNTLSFFLLLLSSFAQISLLAPEVAASSSFAWFTHRKKSASFGLLMALQSKTEPGSLQSSISTTSQKHYSKMNISELVSLLRVVYQVEDFDKIEEELKSEGRDWATPRKA
ncbi:hypothetical protein VIGAN_08225800 [Vigna angularis var. angularis]|uniref:Uncharacterized protein n=1 Tax=Vigna angularis var. angularis TaxID=157739 RepID=A0A0S3SRR9_PHAAN|nr:hypothetical protein VIGAN_08225800 [Vigna angularis var. angularis]